MSKNTLFDKIFQKHVICSSGEDYLLYIDLHLIHEVTSPQAFEGLRQSHRNVRRPNLTFATMDHNVPTKDRDKPLKDLISDRQMKTLKKNCDEFGITLFDLSSEDQGIVHVIGPELGLTLPGKTIVCGDSHTATHGAFGCLAFGIGTSEVEHVLATQSLWQKKPKVMRVNFTGTLQEGVSSKDMILKLIGKIGTAGANGYVLEYTGNVISDLSIEARMTICNMSIEAGARSGMIAPDEKTFKYIHFKKYSLSKEEEVNILPYWKTLYSDKDAEYDAEVTIDCSNLLPQVTWGTSPGMVSSIEDSIPYPDTFHDPNERKSFEKALKYMGLTPGTPIKNLPIDKVFIGSCTNSRIEDMREVAHYVKNKKKSDKIKYVLIVPGSKKVKEEAEKEGLDIIFKNAGFEWREPGCSMCLAMNDDVLEEGDFCASTSNRNFEGRQGKGGKTFLVSPAMAAVAAVYGSFVDVRNY